MNALGQMERKHPRSWEELQGMSFLTSLTVSREITNTRTRLYRPIGIRSE